MAPSPHPARPRAITAKLAVMLTIIDRVRKGNRAIIITMSSRTNSNNSTPPKIIIRKMEADPNSSNPSSRISSRRVVLKR